MSWLGHERRKGPDFWVYILRISALIGWVLFVLALVISHFSAPEPSYGIARYYQVVENDKWLKPLSGYLYIILWSAAFISYLAIVINHYRSRRNDDFAFFNLFLLLFACIAWGVYLVLNIS
mgnify:CR=1 FL=1